MQSSVCIDGYAISSVDLSDRNPFFPRFRARFLIEARRPARRIPARL
jgi:hypothetical protein